jgi:hypothetical protein
MEEEMSNGPQKKPRKFAKYSLIVVAGLVVALTAAHLIWKYSGSGQWEPLYQEHGIQVYAMKSPGSTLKKFKAVGRVRSTLTAAMTLAQDPGVCEYVNCYASKMFERVDERLQYYTFRWEYPLYFKPREFVIEERFSRVPGKVPGTNALLVEVIGAPHKLPPDDCCVRVSHMYNTWRFTPLGNGELEVEYSIDTDAGGIFPYWLSNVGAPKFMTFTMSRVQMILDKMREKHPNASFELVRNE